jgi:3-oxoadipate enol-lactonase
VTAPLIAERSLETARGRTVWLEAGKGWPLVLLHAFPFSAEMWRPQLTHVPDGWRFMAPQLCRMGETTIDDYAADVGALLDALKIDEAVIGGLSMGGYVAFAMHRQEPSRFGGLILADTRPQADTPQGREGRTALREAIAASGMSAVADQMLPKLLSAATASERPEIVADVRRQIESLTPAAADAAVSAMMGRPDSTPDLERISCATLVLVGAEDAITPPEDADAMHRAIARSTMTVIPQAGHLSNLEQPDVFSKALGDFLLAHL